VLPTIMAQLGIDRGALESVRQQIAPQPAFRRDRKNDRKQPAADFAGYFGRNPQGIVGKDSLSPGTMFEVKQFVHVH